MDELVQLITEKTGLPEKQARQAAEVAIDFIKDNLPAPIASQVDNALEGGGLGSGVMKGLGGLLSKD